MELDKLKTIKISDKQTITYDQKNDSYMIEVEIAPGKYNTTIISSSTLEKMYNFSKERNK